MKKKKKKKKKKRGGTIQIHGHKIQIILKNENIKKMKSQINTHWF